MYIEESAPTGKARNLNRRGAAHGAASLPSERRGDRTERPTTPERNELASAPDAPRELTDGPSIETIITKILAQHTESIVETVSARILERVLAEIDARERPAPAPAITVADTDPIDSIPIPTRVITALRRLHINTIGELTALREDSLLTVPSLGEGSVRQLNRILAVYGRRLAV